MKKAKYNIGDLLRYNHFSGSGLIVFIPDEIYFDDSAGEFVYRRKVSSCTYQCLYESDVVDVIEKGSKLYDEYQLFKELKKKFDA